MEIDNLQLPLFISIEPQYTRLYRSYIKNPPTREASTEDEAFWKGYDGILFRKTGYKFYTFAHVSWRAGKDFRKRSEEKYVEMNEKDTIEFKRLAKEMFK